MFENHSLVLVLLLAGLLSGITVSLGLGALARRRSMSYFLIALALVALAGRSVLGFLAYGHLLPSETHHLLEHVMDMVTGGLLLGAVYVSKTTVDPPVERAHE